jgi:DNA-directed RNA polymerase specialized sigma24 family protein
MEKQKADKLILKFSSKVYGFAVKKSYSYDEAEELSGEMLKEVYLSMLQADDIVNVEGYVWRICEHVYAKYVNQIKLQKGVSLDSVDGKTLSYFDDYNLGESEEEILKLRKEIGFLSSCRREIVYSFYYEGKSIAQIAKEHGLPLGTVKWHLNKARNDLKEGFTMERKIGKLGLSPVKAQGFSHMGRPGSKGGPEVYLEDKINLNIVYSVYDSPKTVAEIAEDLGMTPVYLEDKIELLASNGFLVETKGKRYTTYVKFSPKQFSLEAAANGVRMQLKVAKILCENYVPQVRAAVTGLMDKVYIPGGNRELFEAAAIFYAVANKCSLHIEKDLSKHRIKTLDGADYFVSVQNESEIIDPDYKCEFNFDELDKKYWCCGDMTRESQKYPCVYSWSMDSRFDCRKGAWENNLNSDYESLYEIITGAITESKATAEKYKRLRERAFLTDDGKVNVMVVKSSWNDFTNLIPSPDEKLLDEFAKFALEQAMVQAKQYPPQIQDRVIYNVVKFAVGSTVAMMVLDQLYDNKVFRPLTEQEKVTANLLMFCDKLPE